VVGTNGGDNSQKSLENADHCTFLLTFPGTRVNV
jgi:hypothetical protein